jgi:hypothetical protein
MCSSKLFATNQSSAEHAQGSSVRKTAVTLPTARNDASHWFSTQQLAKRRRQSQPSLEHWIALRACLLNKPARIIEGLDGNARKFSGFPLDGRMKSFAARKG